MTGNPRGRVLIISNVSFDTMDDRQPSLHDANNLRNLFERLHFKVVTKEDLTARVSSEPVL